MLPAGGARRVGYGGALCWVRAALAFGLWLSLKVVYFVVALALLSPAAWQFACAPFQQSNLEALA